MCCLSKNKNISLDIDSISNYIISSKNISSVEAIAFTGGEPFLKMNHLKQLISLSNSVNKKTTVITNGFWASNLKSTIEILSEMKMLGLRTIGISYDEFHAKLIPKKNIINLLNAAKIIGLPINIQMTMLNGSNIGNLINDLSPSICETYVNFIPCLPVGNAKKNIPNDKFIRNSSIYNCICQKGGTFLVESDGSIMPCCSPSIFETGFELGNIYNDKEVSVTLDRLKNNMYLYLLRNFGFNYYIDLAQKIGIKLPELIICPCELCSIIFSKKNIHKFFPYAYNKIKDLKMEEKKL